METYYLIDYENVHDEGLSGCQNLGKTDHIRIFYTQNAKKLDMSVIENHGSADLKPIEVPAGKQSVDMHIGSYLGYLAGKYGKACNVVIVSKDTDYDKVIEFWKKKSGVVATRTQQIKNKTQTNNNSITNSKQPSKVNTSKKSMLNQEVMQAVREAGYDATVANKVAQISSGFYGSEYLLRDVHNALREIYTNYRAVYKCIKDVLSKYAN